MMMVVRRLLDFTDRGKKNLNIIMGIKKYIYVQIIPGLEPGRVFPVLVEKRSENTAITSICTSECFYYRKNVSSEFCSKSRIFCENMKI